MEMKQLTTETWRTYEGQKSGTYLTIIENAGQFFEPEMSSSMNYENDSAHFRSVMDDFGNLVVVNRYN